MQVIIFQQVCTSVALTLPQCLKSVGCLYYIQMLRQTNVIYNPVSITEVRNCPTAYYRTGVILESLNY